MTAAPPCPNCGDERTKRTGPYKVRHKEHRRKVVAAYWNVCLRCWHQWDGVSDGGMGVLPVGVVER